MTEAVCCFHYLQSSDDEDAMAVESADKYWANEVHEAMLI